MVARTREDFERMTVADLQTLLERSGVHVVLASSAPRGLDLPEGMRAAVTIDRAGGFTNRAFGNDLFDALLNALVSVAAVGWFDACAEARTA